MFDIMLATEWFTIFEEDDSDAEMYADKDIQSCSSIYGKDQSITIDIDAGGDKLNMEFTGGKTTCDKYFDTIGSPRAGTWIFRKRVTGGYEGPQKAD